MNARDGEQRVGVPGVEVKDALPGIQGVPAALQLLVPDSTEVREDPNPRLVILRDRRLALKYVD